MGNKFYLCRRCGNLVGMIHNSDVPLSCCGEPMELLKANTEETGAEKHLPVVERDKDRVTVKVGKTLHPSDEEHRIEWIYLQTEKGGQRKSLQAGEEPRVSFRLENDEPLAVFSYCNKHGLWKVRIG